MRDRFRTHNLCETRHSRVQIGPQWRLWAQLRPVSDQRGDDPDRRLRRTFSSSAFFIRSVTNPIACGSVISATSPKSCPLSSSRCEMPRFSSSAYKRRKNSRKKLERYRNRTVSDSRTLSRSMRMSRRMEEKKAGSGEYDSVRVSPSAAVKGQRNQEILTVERRLDKLFRRIVHDLDRLRSELRRRSEIVLLSYPFRLDLLHLVERLLRPFGQSRLLVQDVLLPVLFSRSGGEWRVSSCDAGRGIPGRGR